MGLLYLEKENFNEAHKLFDKSCAIGNLEGCYNLAVMYNNGLIDGSKDYVKAAKFYDPACSGGIDQACINLATIYTSHFPNERNNKLSIRNN